MKKSFLIAGLATAMLASCTQQPEKPQLTLSGLNPQKFQTEVDSVATNLYTLKNKTGMEVCITNFGGRIVSIMVPDKNGTMQDVVLGFDSIADYINIPSDFGASIGRYANRINLGRFELDGTKYQLPQNNFGHCLHGGPKGWQYQVYEANPIDSTTLELTRISPDGDQNFPGNVTAKVTFKLTDDNAIDIKYSATTDKPTIINMTEVSVRNVPRDLREGSYALGATKWQTITGVLIPAARSGIVTGVVLGMGRAMGETMAVLLVGGNAPVMPEGLSSMVRTLTMNIITDMAYAEGDHLTSLFTTAIVLFVFILALNLIIQLILKSSMKEQKGSL